MAAGKVKFKAKLGRPPLTFGCFLEGPVQMQVCGSRKDQVRVGTASEVGVPCEAASAAPGLPPAYSRGQGTESGPEECPEGGKELGGQFWGGLEMPLADLRPEPANRGNGLAQIPALPSLVPIHILSLTFTDLPSPLQVGKGDFLFPSCPFCTLS